MFSSSPRLIAAYHVFLRLPTPRHPPDALCNLSLEIAFLPFPVQLSMSRPVSRPVGLPPESHSRGELPPHACSRMAACEIALLTLVGLERLELSTSRLSGVRSNHLSYRPVSAWSFCFRLCRAALASRSCMSKYTPVAASLRSLPETKIPARKPLAFRPRWRRLGHVQLDTLPATNRPAPHPPRRGRLRPSPSTRSWWSWSGSNRRPPACKADALPAELQPQAISRFSKSTRGSLKVSSEREEESLKEVIQPQVPLRLPCYDFTPIIGPTVDGCLPIKGLAYRLRVKPTFVV